MARIVSTKCHEPVSIETHFTLVHKPHLDVFELKKKFRKEFPMHVRHKFSVRSERASDQCSNIMSDVCELNYSGHENVVTL